MDARIPPADIAQGANGAVMDWKSDVSVTPAVRSAYARQLQRYLAATGAKRGAVVFMSLSEIAWIERAAIGDGA